MRKIKRFLGGLQTGQGGKVFFKQKGGGGYCLLVGNVVASLVLNSACFVTAIAQGWESPILKTFMLIGKAFGKDITLLDLSVVNA